MILIIAPESDVHALSVARAIIERSYSGNVRIVDSQRFPYSMSIRIGLDGWRLKDTSGWSVDSENIESIWWRRYKSPSIARTIVDPTVRRFTLNECNHAFRTIGLWPSYVVVNPLDRVIIADNKPAQLVIARGVGLDVPDTIITNEPTSVCAFLDSSERSIFKVMSPPLGAFAETRSMRQEYTKNLKSLHSAPVIFQREVKKKRELRIVCVGSKIFAAEIRTRHVNSRKYPDWRLDPGHECIASEIPTKIEEQILRFMDKLGLYYGCIDLIEDIDGRFMFLEINTSGQYLFVEIDTGFEISRALARLLTEVKCTRGG